VQGNATMLDMSGYEINEEDIQKLVKALKVSDPKNADRDYAIQLLEQYRSLGANLSRSDEALADLLKKGLDNDKPKSS